jgi:hypothetical protein
VTSSLFGINLLNSAFFNERYALYEAENVNSFGIFMFKDRPPRGATRRRHTHARTHTHIHTHTAMQISSYKEFN